MELDERVIALRATEPILVARIDRVCREVISGFKSGKLTQDTIVRLKAEYDAARSLLGVLTEQAGGQQDG